MSTYITPYRSCLLLNETSAYLLDTDLYGLSVSTTDGQSLFELKEPILAAQGTLDDAQQIHLAYIKESGELCYSIILPTGRHQTMSLGKLDTHAQRYDRLFIFPLGKIIHIFYASSHQGLPDVWRITHLFWNGEAWKSAMLGEVVHPRYPMYQVLLDSRANLHVLMTTFLGTRSVVLSSMFNGTFYLWSKRQEVLTIPREVVDMTAIITSKDEGHLFWAAKQPASDRFELGHGVKSKINDFRTNWRIDFAPAANLEGPWNGLGAVESHGLLSLFVHCKQAAVFQVQDGGWKPVSALTGNYAPLYLNYKADGTSTYSFWLSQPNQKLPLFAQELSLGNISYLKESPLAELSSSTETTSPDSTVPRADSTLSSASPSPVQEKTPIPDNTSNSGSPSSDSPPKSSNSSDSANTSNLSSSANSNSSSNLTNSPTDPKLLDQFADTLNELKDTAMSINDKLEFVGENISFLAKDLGTFHEGLGSMTQKTSSLPEVLYLIKELVAQNAQTLNALQKLDLLGDLISQNNQALDTLQRLDSVVYELENSFRDLQNAFNDLRNTTPESPNSSSEPQSPSSENQSLPDESEASTQDLQGFAQESQNPSDDSQLSQAVTAKKGFWQRWLT